MNLSEIKLKLGVQTLGLDRVLTAKDEKTSWFKHWDNSNRIAIVLHEDTLKAIKAGNATSLGINTQMKTGSKGEYTCHTIVKYAEYDETL